MNQGLKFKLIQKTRKESVCEGCGENIPIGSQVISASGLDYDDNFTNWKVHPVKECYMFYVDNIDMVDESDMLALLNKDNQEDHKA